MDTPDCVCVRRLYVLSRKARGNRPKSCHVQSKEQNIRFNSNPQEITEKNPRNIFLMNNFKFQNQNPQKREIQTMNLKLDKNPQIVLICLAKIQNVNINFLIWKSVDWYHFLLASNSKSLK